MSKTFTFVPAALEMATKSRRFFMPNNLDYRDCYLRGLALWREYFMYIFHGERAPEWARYVDQLPLDTLLRRVSGATGRLLQQFNANPLMKAIAEFSAYDYNKEFFAVLPAKLPCGAKKPADLAIILEEEFLFPIAELLLEEKRIPDEAEYSAFRQLEKFVTDLRRKDPTLFIIIFAQVCSDLVQISQGQAQPSTDSFHANIRTTLANHL